MARWKNSFQAVHCNSEGHCTWDKPSPRVPFTATTTATCGVFDWDFPDDAHWIGTLSDDYQSIIEFGWKKQPK